MVAQAFYESLATVVKIQGVHRRATLAALGTTMAVEVSRSADVQELPE